ncbi:MAG: MBL fold metallo-hydrolase [Eubacteriales bacterium]|nr:MBL fold metallo-hydrolase [Eubacteriales bacterium]MDY3333277.1 MBL fold metallo-hydrolase [Gallibacter sp.]
MGIKIEKFVGGALDTNGYIVYKNDGGSCYFIDSGYRTDEYETFIKEHNLTPKGILFTHHHYDHTSDSPQLAKKLDLPIYIHEEDYEMLKKTFKENISLVKTFKTDSEFDLDGEKITFIQLKGHTKGGVAICFEESGVRFTGDTIFDTEIGITDLEDGGYDEMSESCLAVSQWDNSIHIYPGHGDDATMDFVKLYNEELKEALVYYDENH